MPEIPPELIPVDPVELRRLFGGNCDFIAGAPTPQAVPPASLPEFGFVGRSNVGKSSLVNALTGRKTLARVSHTPGRTQQLNFFDLGGRLILVDMPGYGFAKVSKSQSDSWNALVRKFLRGRQTLRCVFILVDSRHGFKDTDRDVMKLLDTAAVSYRIVLTKGDEAKASELAKTAESVTAELTKHPAAFPDIILTSAHKGDGIDDLRASIYRLI